MVSKKTCFLIISILILAGSCKSEQDAVPKQTQLTASQPAAGQAFDSRTITRAQYDATMEEVKQFIEDLNRIIGSGNYNSWRAALSQEYFNQISSPENLRQISEQPAMKTRNIVLRTPQDYFNNVVVPSRANSRVDDIEFIDRNRVKAYTVNTNRQGREERLLLYDLEKIGNSWKIIN